MNVQPQKQPRKLLLVLIYHQSPLRPSYPAVILSKHTNGFQWQVALTPS